MKISFFGSSLVSSYWNGAATYYRGILKALAALGHEITFYEPDAFERQGHRDIPDPPWARVVVYPATSEGWQRSLKAAARSAVSWASGWSSAGGCSTAASSPASGRAGITAPAAAG